MPNKHRSKSPEFGLRTFACKWFRARHSSPARAARRLLCGLGLGLLWLGLPMPGGAQHFAISPATNSGSSVIVVQDNQATEAYRARPDVVAQMFRRGLLQLTGTTNSTAAWLSLVTTQDVVGIKVYAKAGPHSGTRPTLIAALVQSLIAAGMPKEQIIIWDRELRDLRDAGFWELGEKLGVRVQTAVGAGWDAAHYYDTALIGNLVPDDLEFERKGEGVGRKSHLSRLVTQQITKIISVAPLLNHNDAGVCGHLFSVALGSVDNIQRFENNAARLAVAVPEIYALPELGDRVVLNITDALICQYEGGQRGLLHYSVMLNQLRFSRDPVALDALSLKELEAQRRAAKAPMLRPNVELYRNAALLELGQSDPALLRMETLRN